MKNKFILLLLSAVPFVSISQTELHLDGESIGFEYTIDSATSSVEYLGSKLYIYNPGSNSISVSYSRERLYHKNGWTDQVCDSQLCFDAADQTTWSRPAEPALTIPAGDSSLFQPKIWPNGVDGCSVYKYYIYEGLGIKVDSIQISFTIAGQNCYLNVEDDVEDITYNVYPNPANDFINVTIDYAEGVTFALYDIVGKEVANMNLVNGKNQLNIESLNAGVYFYSVKRGNDIIETKKLIVK